jgi:hypothetical protein
MSQKNTSNCAEWVKAVYHNVIPNYMFFVKTVLLARIPLSHLSYNNEYIGMCEWGK